MRLNHNYGGTGNRKRLVARSAAGSIFPTQEIFQFCFCMQGEVILRS